MGYPCEMFGSDTDGEKTFEEFYTDADVKDETTFVNLGVVKNAKRRPVAEVEAIFAKLREVFDRAGATKEDVVAALGEYLPNPTFHVREQNPSGCWGFAHRSSLHSRFRRVGSFA